MRCSNLFNNSLIAADSFILVQFFLSSNQSILHSTVLEQSVMNYFILHFDIYTDQTSQITHKNLRDASTKY
jgi:hypothetical protein